MLFAAVTGWVTHAYDDDVDEDDASLSTMHLLIILLLELLWHDGYSLGVKKHFN